MPIIWDSGKVRKGREYETVIWVDTLISCWKRKSKKNPGSAIVKVDLKSRENFILSHK